MDTVTEYISEADKAAIAALLTRWNEAWQRRKADLLLKEEVDARIAGYNAQFGLLKSAFSVFGLESGTTESWDKIREVIGADAYTAALRRRPPPPPLALPAPEPEVASGSSDEVAQKTEVVEETEMADGAVHSVRVMTLACLIEAKDKGCKAAEIRAHVEARRGDQLHEKTIGMTLYRLSKLGLARREGRTWFAVETRNDTKNPGGETPGLSEDVDDLL